MRGHESIIAARMKRLAPPFVFINDYPCQTDWFETGDHATVCVAGDVVQLLDLRYLKGLRVSISSSSEIRAKALFEQAKSAGASTVAAGHTQPGMPLHKQRGWNEIYHRDVTYA